MQEEKKIKENIFDSGTYEIIRNRLQNLTGELSNRIEQLNTTRKKIFGNVEINLISNIRINTENHCIASDIVTIGEHSILGYNVQFGLKQEIQLSDVFCIYTFDGNSFKQKKLDLINDPQFATDFTNLYKYYKSTSFSRFVQVKNNLHMVFQISEKPEDFKTFKWAIDKDKLIYIDNRSEHECNFPAQVEFNWQNADRSMHRNGVHAHISILDKVFVEAIGGDLTIKIEDNTEDGKGIYREPVEHKDQTLDDGQYRYANLGNLISLEITPFQEEPRYFIYNHKIKEVKKIDSIKESCILLPDEQGVIFANGYYLQSGGYKVFDHGISNAKFERKIVSPNGEDYCYVFFESDSGHYILLPYNVIDQNVKITIICNGFTILDKGELCYLKVDEEQTKHHVIQIWQTPFVKGDILPSEHKDTLLYKVGNKDIVKAMAECSMLITLLNKGDNYDSLYDDLAKTSTDILDSYHWLTEKEMFELSEPIKEINNAANSAIDEFEKVVQLRSRAGELTQITNKECSLLFDKAKSSTFKSIDEYVEILSQLRTKRGTVIELKEVRYIDTDHLNKLELEIQEWSDKISQRCIQFLLNGKALLPYENRVKDKYTHLEKISKVVDGKKLNEEVNQIGKDLEMLIDIVTNLNIEDTSHSTKIVDNISAILANLNKLKASIKNKVKDLGSKEAKAEFSSQIKLIEQSVINYLEVAKTQEKVDEMLNKVAIQLEELEGKFADHDAFIEKISEKRTEIYSVFEVRKNNLIEARNKKATTLEEIAKRILKGIEKKSLSINSIAEINGYFASDLMVNKLRDTISQLKELDAIGKAEGIATTLQVAKEDAIRKYKDKKDLFEDNDNIIKLGDYRFGVNKQVLNLSILHKDKKLMYHLSGTNFYQPIKNEKLIRSKKYWEQDLISENEIVYRAAYLAYNIFQENKSKIYDFTKKQLSQLINDKIESKYNEGYIKGVHDADALKILTALAKTHYELGLLRFTPMIRAFAQHYWFSLDNNTQAYWDEILKSTGEVIKQFPSSKEYKDVVSKLAKEIVNNDQFVSLLNATDDFVGQDLNKVITQISSYLFFELASDNTFVISKNANKTLDEFTKHIKKLNLQPRLDKVLKRWNIDSEKNDQHIAITLLLQWINSFIKSNSDNTYYAHEIVSALLYHKLLDLKEIVINPTFEINGLLGDHPSISDGKYTFNYHNFIASLNQFVEIDVPGFESFRQAKQETIESLKEDLRLSEFEPNVLSSFVRNKLIDEVYLPLFGANLSKQLGSISKDNVQTDRMGMLLLVSPPGYGKTTLMEYIANRLGLVFMKINGPAIGHEITSVDPMAAKNAAARKELEKLNLAFEMGNNVMLYLDDIQHCNPEFLQKFISLADGTRKIEGVYKGVPKTYNLRSNKFCVIMAGNPYTESGEKFQIPDMLANRADTYNLGDIIGNTDKLFNLSLIENSLSSNAYLRQVNNKNFEDIYKLIELVEHPSKEGVDLEGNYSKQEVEDFKSVLSKVIKVRNTVLKVNATYIASAAMEDMHRVEPPFRLQGSYRDMNKLVTKIVPIMNDKELDSLLLSHYESESQTLTSKAEENLLKFKELVSKLTEEEHERWEKIKNTYRKKMKLLGFGSDNNLAQVISQMGDFNEHLLGIQEVLKRAIDGSK